MYGTLAPKPPSASFGGRIFTTPVPFPTLATPIGGGIYAILVHDGMYGGPLQRLLYFGESQSLSSRCTASHEKYQDWVRASGGKQLFIAFHPTMGLNDQQRKDAECALINQYRPPCNDRVDTSGMLRALFS